MREAVHHIRQPDYMLLTRPGHGVCIKMTNVMSVENLPLVTIHVTVSSVVVHRSR